MEPPASLTSSDLTRIASTAAGHAPPWLREDIAQEVQLRFVIYRPTNKSWAWKIANGARVDICRAEGKQVATIQALAQGLPPALSTYERNRQRGRRYYAGHREAIKKQRRTAYRNDLEASRAKTRERVRRHRLSIAAVATEQSTSGRASG